MCNVGNSPGTKKLAEKFNESVGKNKDWSRNRNDSPDVDYVARIDYGIGKKNRIYGTACTDKKNVKADQIVNQHGYEAVHDSAQNVEQEKFL